jgi:hypothetical protein
MTRCFASHYLKERRYVPAQNIPLADRVRDDAAGRGDTHAQESTLGTVDFPTSGASQAQTHFLRGVAALHSFWYPVALDEFRASTRIDPDLMCSR